MITWERTFQLAPGARVQVTEWCGPVKVYKWDEAFIKATATARHEVPLEERITVAEQGDLVKFGLKYPRKFLGLIQLEFGDGKPVELELRVPAGTPCELESGAGSVEVVGTRAPVRVDSGSGSVTVIDVADAQIDSGSGAVVVKNIAGSVYADTGSGSVSAENVAGGLRADTGSGSASIRRVQGDVHVDTGSGSAHVTDVVGTLYIDTGSGTVSVDRVQGDSLHVDTGGGSVRMTGIDVSNLEVDTSSGRVDLELLAVYPGGSYSLDTGSGGVTVLLPHDAGLTVEIDSGSGRVGYSGLDLQVRHREDGELKGELNGGGAMLRIDSGSGGVLLKPAGPAPGVAKVQSAVKGDTAVEQSQQLRRVLNMVQEGKLSPDEAEAILRALDEEEAPV